MKNSTLFLALLLTLKLGAQTNLESGKATFKSRCTACHSINDKLVGPALKDVDKRHSEEWIIKFVHSSQTVIKNGDASAVKLFNANNQQIMPDHADLKDADIQNIIAFIKQESSAPTPSANSAIERPYEAKGIDRPLTPDSYAIFAIFAVFVGLVLLMFFSFIRAVDAMKR